MRGVIVWVLAAAALGCLLSAAYWLGQHDAYRDIAELLQQQQSRAERIPSTPRWEV